MFSGLYKVKFVTPTGFDNITPANVGDDTKDSDVGQDGISHTITLDATRPALDTLRNNPNIDAGFIKYGSIGDFVFDDLNGNGTQDGTDAPIEGVKVFLLDGQTGAKLDSTLTDLNGKYLFDSLVSGNYQVQFVTPGGYDNVTKPNSGGDDTRDSDAGTDGKSQLLTIDTTRPTSDTLRNNLNVDAGFIKYGSIGDYVWSDANADGQQGPVGTEPPIQGVTVYLLNGTTGAKLDSTLTDSNGKYGFDSLLTGTYKVQFVKPVGYDTVTLANTGIDSLDSDISAAGITHLITINTALAANDTLRNNPTIDAGFVKYGSIGDFVWIDLNNNGQQENGEPGLNGVKMYLWSAVGGSPSVRLDSTITTNGGQYSFTKLLPGEYIVQVDLASVSDTLQLTLQNTGSDGTDSDFGLTGLSDVVSINPEQGGIQRDNPTIDLGFFSPCILPTFRATATAATCNGKTANSDASFSFTNIQNGDRITFSLTVAGLAPYASATPLVGGSFNATNLPAATLPGGQQYFVRIYNGRSGCSKDTTIVIPYFDCGSVCVKPNAGPDVYVCKPATSTNLPDALSYEEWVAAASNKVGATIHPQTGVVSGMVESGIYRFILRDKTVGTCADTVVVYRGVLEMAGTQSTCFDTLNLPAVAGATWQGVAGNTATITPDGKITGMTDPGVTYTFVISNAFCSDTFAVRRLVCQGDIDLGLDKSIDKKLAMLGDTVTYTIAVYNEGKATVHGIEVTDTLSNGVQYISSSADRGTYSLINKKWSFDSLEVGDTVRLRIKVLVIGQGTWLNTAEISKTTEGDVDSTPGNNVVGEDDQDSECFTVPYLVCRGQGVDLTFSVPQGYTNVVWFRKVSGGVPVAVGQGNTYVASENDLGTYEYTFTATQANCPATGCCPIIVVVEDCCPAEICVPMVIQKLPKK